jgi:hypothetical protein
MCSAKPRCPKKKKTHIHIAPATSAVVKVKRRLLHTAVALFLDYDHKNSTRGLPHGTAESAVGSPFSSSAVDN